MSIPLLPAGCEGWFADIGESLQPQQSRQQSQQSARVGQSLLDAAKEAERQRDYRSAMAYYGSVYDKDQANEVALVGLSRNMRRLGRATEAEAVLGRALKRDDTSARVLSEMGKVQLVLGRPLDAIEPLSRATALGESGWDVQLALAVAYDRISMFDKAERRYEAALKDSPDNAVVLNNFGLSRAQSGKLDAGIGLLEKATALPEATAKMRQNLALLYAMNGDFDAAERLVRQDLSEADAEANLAYYRKLHKDVVPGAPISLPGSATQMDAGNGALGGAAETAPQQGKAAKPSE